MAIERAGAAVIPAGSTNPALRQEEARALARLDELGERLDSAADLAEIADLREQFEALRRLWQVRGDSLLVQNEATEKRFWADVAFGRKYREIPRRRGPNASLGKTARSGQFFACNDEERLSALRERLKITRQQADRCVDHAELVDDLGEDPIRGFFLSVTLDGVEASMAELQRRASLARLAPDAETATQVMATPRPSEGKGSWQTPPEALGPIVELLKRLGLDDGWDPMCGHGNIVEGLSANGIRMRGTDLRDGPHHDFLNCPLPAGVRFICTNPDGAVKTQTVARCYRHGLPWLLLQPADALLGKERQELYSSKSPDMQILTLGGRIAFETPTGRKGADSNPHEEYAWFTWRLGLPKQITYGKAFLPPIVPEALLS